MSHTSQTVTPNKTYLRKKTMPFSPHKFQTHILRKGGMLMKVAVRRFYEIKDLSLLLPLSGRFFVEYLLLYTCRYNIYFVLLLDWG